MSRKLIVVDFETTGLGKFDVIVEAAAVDVDSGKVLYFVPALEDEKLKVESLFALKLNGYVERELWKQSETPNRTRDLYRELNYMLDGNVFAGSNPAFDSRLLMNQVGKGLWHHRLGDLATYAAGKLDLDLTDLPGLDKVAELMNVDIKGRHGALEDALATARLFRILREM